MNEAILLIGHGSKDPAGEHEFRLFASALERRIGCFVQPAFLEFNDPPIADAIRRCADAGARRIVVMPLFLGAATHQKNDVPATVNWARGQYPGVSFAYGAPLGAHALIARALAVRTLDALKGMATAAAALDSTSILLVGRGSRDPDSNSELYKVGRLLYEGRGFGWVEACYIAISRPDLPEGLERCLRLGARRVVVVPHMLFTGTLTKRTELFASQFQARHPELDIAVASPLGTQDDVLAVVEQRIHEARSGVAAANCDSCKYRLSMVGFEDDLGLPQASDHSHGLRGIELAPHVHSISSAGHIHPSEPGT
ncbi:MAG: sirohydrochlorin chelatase [Dehalococcoidia bacterium]